MVYLCLLPFRNGGECELLAESDRLVNSYKVDRTSYEVKFLSYLSLPKL